MNIKLSYLYRDGANYKQYHQEIFTNNNFLAIEEIRKRLINHLIDGQWFYCNNWGLKDIHKHQWDNEIDHRWHEFDSIDYSIEEATNNDILELIQYVESKDMYSL